MVEMANFVKIQTNFFFEKTVSRAVEDGQYSKDEAIKDLREVKEVAYEARKKADILRIGRYDFNVISTTSETPLKENMTKKQKDSGRNKNSELKKIIMK
jgi:hypothetical protein